VAVESLSLGGFAHDELVRSGYREAASNDRYIRELIDWRWIHIGVVGRVGSNFVAVVRGGPKLGETESGIAASFGGLQFAAVSGGLLCLIWIAVVAAAYPELRSWESKPTP
jgi:hypothetical protein